MASGNFLQRLREEFEMSAKALFAVSQDGLELYDIVHQVTRAPPGSSAKPRKVSPKEETPTKDARATKAIKRATPDDDQTPEPEDTLAHIFDRHFPSAAARSHEQTPTKKRATTTTPKKRKLTQYESDGSDVILGWSASSRSPSPAAISAAELPRRATKETPKAEKPVDKNKNKDRKERKPVKAPVIEAVKTVESTPSRASAKKIVKSR